MKTVLCISRLQKNPVKQVQEPPWLQTERRLCAVYSVGTLAVNKKIIISVFYVVSQRSNIVK